MVRLTSASSPRTAHFVNSSKASGVEPHGQKPCPSTMPTVSPMCAGADLVVEESPFRDPALAARFAGVPKINHAIKRAPNPTTARANARSGPVSRGVGELLVDRPTGSSCGFGWSEIGRGGRGAVTNRTFRQAEHLTRPVGEISTVRHEGHVTRTFSACLTVSYRQTKTIALNSRSRDSTLKLPNNLPSRPYGCLWYACFCWRLPCSTRKMRILSRPGR